ncbi:MAG: hypothetical protein K0R83_440 [Caulobacter sp.]|jgi:hypothetical protein|nr:hypothetical protein [Caulobacter sp.]
MLEEIRIAKAATSPEEPGILGRLARIDAKLRAQTAPIPTVSGQIFN